MDINNFELLLLNLYLSGNGYCILYDNWLTMSKNVEHKSVYRIQNCNSQIQVF